MPNLYIGSISSKKGFKLEFSIIANSEEHLLEQIRDEYPNKIWNGKIYISKSYTLDEGDCDYFLYIGKYTMLGSENHFIVVAEHSAECKKLVTNLEGFLIDNYQLEETYRLATHKKYSRDGKKYKKPISYNSEIVEIYSEAFSNTSKNMDSSTISDAKLILYI